MDILSHGLWGSLGALVANRKTNLKLKPRYAFLWGIFPDLFAFTPAFVYRFWMTLTRGEAFWMRPQDMEPPVLQTPIVQLSSGLYDISHSLIIFALVFATISLIRKKRPWVMGAWLLHILMDIPTHSYQFFPTPFLWPLSNWEFNGFSWAQPWFMALNYGALLVVYLVLRFKPKTR